MAKKKNIPLQDIIDLHNQGLYDKEIAQILGISESNAIKLDQRAKKKLRQLCEEEGML